MNKPTYFSLLFVLFFSFTFTYQSTLAQQTEPDSLNRPIADSLVLVPKDTPAAQKKFIYLDSLQYRFIGDGMFTQGNINRTLIVLRGDITYQGPIVSLSTNPRFTYGKQNEQVAERDLFVDLFVDIYKKRKVYGFGLATLETSNLRGIDLRRLTGAGVGFRLRETPQHSLSLTNAIIYESTNFRTRPTLTTLRNSTRLKGRHSFLSNRMRFLHITYLQPSLYDFSNVRWNTLLTLELPLSKWISFRSSYEGTYESVIEATRKNYDSRLTVGLSIGNKF